MSRHALWSYLASAHHAHLMREAAMARAAHRSGWLKSLPAVVNKLLVL